MTGQYFVCEREGKLKLSCAMAEERQLSGQGLYGARHRAARPARSATLPAPAAAATVMRDMSPGTASPMRRRALVPIPSSGGTAGRAQRRRRMEPHGEKPERLRSFSAVPTRGGKWSNFVKSCGWLHLPRHGEPSCLRGQNRQGATGLRSELHDGEPPGPAVSLLRLMEPILIQDAEDIIDLNKLSVKEKL